jgi:tetratricopeptide (TPR) repeat protein
VELRRRVQGEEHPDPRRSMNNLAKDYMQEGKLGQAEQLFQQTIAIQTRVQGPEHPDTLRTMYNLGTVYERQGKASDAENLFSRILAARTRALGAAHPDTLNTQVALGRAQVEQGKFAAAQQTLREALRTYEQAAPDRWEKYYCETLTGAAAAGQKNFAQAETLLQGGYDGMEQRKIAIPAENRGALEEARGRLAQFYRDSGKPEKADVILRKVP